MYNSTYVLCIIIVRMLRALNLIGARAISGRRAHLSHSGTEPFWHATSPHNAQHSTSSLASQPACACALWRGGGGGREGLVTIIARFFAIDCLLDQLLVPRSTSKACGADSSTTTFHYRWEDSRIHPSRIKVRHELRLVLS